MTRPCIILGGHLTLPLAVIQSDVDLLEAEAAVPRGGGEAVLAGVHPDRLNNHNQSYNMRECLTFPSFCHLHSPPLLLTRQVRVTEPGTMCLMKMLSR